MDPTPRRLGLLGGITWHSTLVYERLLHDGVARALPGRTADLVARHYEFGEIARLQEEGDWEALAARFARDARWLVDGGAQAILICANTMHVIADRVEDAAGVPVIHVVDEVATAIRAAGLDTVALLGTGFTMRMPFYRDRLAALGVGALVPAEPGLTELHDLIYQRLARGIVDEEGRALVRDLTASLAERGAQGVIAGCTEIPMAMTAAESPLPYFDALELHAAAGVRFALGG